MLRRELSLICLAISVAANVWIGRLALEQNARIEGLTARPTLSKGLSLPPLTVQDASGASVSIRFGDSRVPTLLYVMSPSCHWCDANTRSIQTLAAALGSSHRVIGVALHLPQPFELQKYAQGLRLPFPLLSGNSVGRDLRVISTPTTIVVSPESVVTDFWEGAFVGQIRQSIQERFGVLLPEIAAAQYKVEGRP